MTTPPKPMYWPFYCEENIWHLCADPQFERADPRVLFISNAARRFAMWGQRSAVEPSLPIVWDYHVVLLARGVGDLAGGFAIWDFDGLDPSPRSASAWLRSSFESIGLLPPIYEPRFRMLAAADYQQHFRSDRRHMRSADGIVREPPPWPAILAGASEGSNLDALIDMTSSPSEADWLGEVFDLSELRRWFENQRPSRA
jgi:hypothetical protein